MCWVHSSPVNDIVWCAQRADIPDFSATAVCTALAYLHGVWVAIAVELDLDEPTGASKVCPANPR